MSKSAQNLQKTSRGSNLLNKINFSSFRGITAVQNVYTTIWALGEGFHNYHHVFPWDYKTAEHGNYRYNFSTAFIDLMAKIGLAYDLKTVSNEMIEARKKRTGDGSIEIETNIWGWNDPSISKTDRKMVTVIHPSG